MMVSDVKRYQIIIPQYFDAPWFPSKVEVRRTLHKQTGEARPWSVTIRDNHSIPEATHRVCACLKVVVPVDTCVVVHHIPVDTFYCRILGCRPKDCTKFEIVKIARIVSGSSSESCESAAIRGTGIGRTPMCGARCLHLATGYARTSEVIC